MELEDLKALTGDITNLQARFQKEKPKIDAATFAAQYDPKSHDVMKTDKRPDKTINTEQGQSTVFVARLPIPMQQKIVRISAAFLCGNPIKLSATPTADVEKNILAVVQKVWNDQRLRWTSKTLLKLMMAECECAELWYTEPADPDYWANTPAEGGRFRLRIKVLAESLGDSLYPSYNMYGDMIAFARGYKIAVGDKLEEHFDVYTADTTYLSVKGAGGWETKPEANIVGKIPVVYYRQDYPEWYYVQEMIDRLEKLISNHGDSNDYFGSPMVKVKGKVLGMSSKGESGKVIEIEPGGDAEYMVWSQAPESIKLEYSNLRSLIFDMTDTPDISFENMKSLGVFSGIALKLLFMGAHMKAADKEELFGPGVQRRINYLKAAVAKIAVKLESGIVLSIEPEFEYYLPKNDQETINNLSMATGAKPTLSQETAVKMNPYVTDPDEELKRILGEGVDPVMDPPAV